MLGVLGAIAALTASACKFDEVTVPATKAQVVVHAVLNPNALTQVVLLERTLNGTVTVYDSAFDPNNPIITGGGVPVSNASVDLVDSLGRATHGVEDHTPGGIGTGVYRIAFSRALQLGARYQLKIRTLEGENVTGAARIPRPVTTSSDALTRTFNRDHDSLKIFWNPAASTRAYAVRAESPFGPFFLFTDSTRLLLTGDTRNLFADNIQRLFIPGFRQDVLIAAVDSNFYDYYRTNNDPFTGSGIISRISGGIGLFGAMVTLTNGTVIVTADQTEPIEGRYRLTPAATLDVTQVNTLNLYIESKSSRSDVPDALSGRYTTGGVSPRADGIVGTMSGTHVVLAILANQLAHDTLDVFTGELTNGQLVGTYRKRPGTAVFVKQ